MLLLLTALLAIPPPAFGYHLGIVNGPLEAIAGDLGFLGDKAKEGLVSMASADLGCFECTR